jgi:hypothetical protein
VEDKLSLVEDYRAWHRAVQRVCGGRSRQSTPWLGTRFDHQIGSADAQGGDYHKGAVAVVAGHDGLDAVVLIKMGDEVSRMEVTLVRPSCWRQGGRRFAVAQGHHGRASRGQGQCSHDEL